MLEDCVKWRDTTYDKHKPKLQHAQVWLRIVHGIKNLYFKTLREAQFFKKVKKCKTTKEKLALLKSTMKHEIEDLKTITDEDLAVLLLLIDDNNFPINDMLNGLKTTEHEQKRIEQFQQAL